MISRTMEHWVIYYKSYKCVMIAYLSYKVPIWGKMGENGGYRYWILTQMHFDPSECSFVSDSGSHCQILSNRIKIATLRARTDRHTDIDRDHAFDLIICPMLCYSNGTDN